MPNTYCLIPTPSHQLHRLPERLPDRLVDEQVGLAVHVRGRTVDDHQPAPVILHKARRRVHSQGCAADDQQVAGGDGVQRVLDGVGGQGFFI